MYSLGRCGQGDKVIDAGKYVQWGSGDGQEIWDIGRQSGGEAVISAEINWKSPKLCLLHTLPPATRTIPPSS